MSRVCELMLLAFVIAIGNLATAEKVSDYELLLPIGFDARIMGKGVGQPVLILLFSAIYACVLFMLATLFVGLLLWCTCRDTMRDTIQSDKQFDKSHSNDKEGKRAHIIPTNRGKVVLETEPGSESKQKNEDLWQALRRVSGPTGAGPPTYMMKDTQEHEEVEKLNFTSAENELANVETGHGTSSSDDDFVDLDNIVTKPVRESKPPPLSSLDQIENSVPGDWECEWCFERNPIQSKQCSYCSHLSPRATQIRKAHTAEHSNAATIVNDIVNDTNQNDVMNNNIINDRARAASMPALDGSTTLFAANDLSTEASSSTDEEYVDMDTMLSTPHNPTKSRSLPAIISSTGTWECEWCFERNPAKSKQCSYCSRPSPSRAQRQARASAAAQTSSAMYGDGAPTSKSNSSFTFSN